MIEPVEILSQKLAGLGVEGVSPEGNGWRLDFTLEATQEQRIQAEAIAAAFDPIAAVADAEAAEQEVINSGKATKQWLLDNSNAMLLLDLSVTELQAEITALVNAAFPAPITQQTRNKVTLLWMTYAMAIRVLIKHEGLG